MFGAMAGQTREPKVRVDADGVRIHELPHVRARVWLIVFVAAIAIALLLIVRPHARTEVVERVAPPPRAAAPPAMAGGAHIPAERAAVPPPVRPRVPAVPDAAVAPQNPAAAAGAPDDEPPPHEPMFGAAAPGAPSGVALFPPPGTKPIKRGLVVPDDFELPPGYVRHYQATDDGERVPAILMFHPDYHPVDEHGDPIPLPADRVVPAEMAPPGMPIEMLELPEQPSAPDGAR
jgi:hypothetical protein